MFLSEFKLSFACAAILIVNFSSIQFVGAKHSEVLVKDILTADRALKAVSACEGCVTFTKALDPHPQFDRGTIIAAIKQGCNGKVTPEFKAFCAIVMQDRVEFFTDAYISTRPGHGKEACHSVDIC